MTAKRSLILALVLQAVVLAQSPEIPKSSLFKVSLPLNVNPETVKIEIGIYGRGLSMSEIRTRPGVYEYPIDLNGTSVGPARSLKLLIYVPGYRMVAYEFKDAELGGRTFIPPLVDLPTVVVRGKLLDSTETPLAARSLSVTYSLSEAMPYFGYIDGFVPQIGIGRVKTDSKGEFAISVPSFADDPFFKPSGLFALASDDAGLMDSTLKPNRFSVQKTYDFLVVRKRQKGTLSGHLGTQFFRENNLSADLKAYVRPGEAIMTMIRLDATTSDGDARFSFNANLEMDGSFEVNLPAGQYDLELWVSELGENLLVQRGVVVEENKRQIVERP